MIIKDYELAKSKMLLNKGESIIAIEDDDFFERDYFLLLLVEKINDVFNFVPDFKEEDIRNVFDVLVRVNTKEMLTLYQTQQILDQVRKINDNGINIIFGLNISDEFENIEVLVALSSFN